MTAYAFWNNKGGVCKSFLGFVAATEYAHRYPDTDVYVIDLCPRANISETLLGGYVNGAKAIRKLVKTDPRATIAGYMEGRLNSPFKMLNDVSLYIRHPHDMNKAIPENIQLICGDNLTGILSEAIRQTSQLSIPADSWKRVISWIRDIIVVLRDRSGGRDSVFMVDCNPSFAIYTQLAVAACDFLVIPFTADDSSRRAIENIAALIYGIGDPKVNAYARTGFAGRAREQGVSTPKIHTLVRNRMTSYERPHKAFEAISKMIRETIDSLHKKHRVIFAHPSQKPSQGIIDIPHCHSAGAVTSMKGIPFHKLRAGSYDIAETKVRINPASLKSCREALDTFVNCL